MKERKCEILQVLGDEQAALPFEMAMRIPMVPYTRREGIGDSRLEREMAAIPLGDIKEIIDDRPRTVIYLKREEGFLKFAYDPSLDKSLGLKILEEKTFEDFGAFVEELERYVK